MKTFCFVFLFLLYGTLTSYALKPVKAYSMTPKSLGIDYKEIFVASGEERICTWLLQQQDTTEKRTVIICNSDYGNMSYSLQIANEFYKRGLNVILFDYDGFGASTGSIADTNMLFYHSFSADLVNVASFYQQKEQLIFRVYASSMGTIMATEAFAMRPELFTGGFYFDSFVASPDYTVSFLKKTKSRPFKAPVDDATYLASVNKLKRCHVVFYRGKTDEVTHPLKKPFMQTAANWEVIEYDGGHMQAPHILGEALFNAVCGK